MKTLNTTPKWACEVTMPVDGKTVKYLWCYKFNSFMPGPKFRLLRPQDLAKARHSKPPYIVMGFFTRKDAQDQAIRLQKLFVAPQYPENTTVTVVAFSLLMEGGRVIQDREGVS